MGSVQLWSARSPPHSRTPRRSLWSARVHRDFVAELRREGVEGLGVVEDEVGKVVSK